MDNESASIGSDSFGIENAEKLCDLLHATKYKWISIISFPFIFTIATTNGIVSYRFPFKFK